MTFLLSSVHNCYCLFNAKTKSVYWKLSKPCINPKMTCDQQLSAIATQIQLDLTDMYGETKFVILLNGLHIEIAALKTIKDFAGTEDSVRLGSHVPTCLSSNSMYLV
jgi:hypothetical protein